MQRPSCCHAGRFLSRGHVFSCHAGCHAAQRRPHGVARPAAAARGAGGRRSAAGARGAALLPIPRYGNAGLAAQLALRLCFVYASRALGRCPESG